MISEFIRQGLLIIKYAYQAKPWNFHKFPLLRHFEGEKAYVLVNGPSLKKTLQSYDNGNQIITNDAFVVNLFALDRHFKSIRPKHYCLSDPMFYQDFPPKKDDIRRMYDVLQEEVDWDMYLYLCFYTDKEYNRLKYYSGISNPHIKIVLMNRKVCDNLHPKIRNRLYASGYFMPEDGTIANTAIYLALIEGYKEIELYGADHTMFLELSVNEKNELCSYDSHFYDNDKPQLKVLRNCNSIECSVFRVHDFLFAVSVMFRSHDLLRALADYLGVRILNCTKGSMIDSYERKKFED